MVASMDAVTILDFPTGYFFVIYLGYFAKLGGKLEHSFMVTKNSL